MFTIQQYQQFEVDEILLTNSQIRLETYWISKNYHIAKQK